MSQPLSSESTAQLVSLKESKNFGKIFLKYQKGFNRFRKYVVYLTKHTNKKISEKKTKTSFEE